MPLPLKNIALHELDLLLPPLCLTCDEPVGGAATLCLVCWKQIQFIVPLCADVAARLLGAGEKQVHVLTLSRVRSVA